MARYRLILEPVRDRKGAPVEVRLRAALKLLLRYCKLRCVEPVVELKEDREEREMAA